jgi:cyclopropane fatty-acyl-phospholipid synthase-like methyltransferase
VQREHWFEELADHLQEAYLRYSFTKGTTVEVDQIISQLQLRPGDYVLDVGCGPGRHSLELGRRGIRCLGIDISVANSTKRAEISMPRHRIPRLPSSREWRPGPQPTSNT